MTATDAQVRIIMRERNQVRTQTQAAARANLKSRQAVAKYEQLGEVPSTLKQRRAYRTRRDPLAEDWPVVKAKLQQTPERLLLDSYYNVQRIRAATPPPATT